MECAFLDGLNELGGLGSNSRDGGKGCFSFSVRDVSDDVLVFRASVGLSDVDVSLD